MGKKRNIIISGETQEDAPKQSGTDSPVSQNNTPKNPKRTKKNSRARGKDYKTALSKIDKTKTYPVSEAIRILKEATYSKNNNTVEFHINLGLDMEKAEHKIRTMITFPNGTGREIKILTISANETPKIEDIISKKLIPGRDFDLVVAHPEIMKDLAKVAKVLGPKGMMPNPKSGTVSEDVEKTASELKKGATEIKTEKSAPVIHGIIGKLDFEDNKLVENFEALITKIKESRPPKVKGAYIKSIYLCSSMSPSVKISL
jgi:large subunit ribosomal protein L1